MPLKKIVLKPGVNRENTRYTNEGGYYESNLVRFRQGTPEKIGGWTRISDNQIGSPCRSLWNWVTLTKGVVPSANLVGVGTEQKFFITQQTTNATDAYYDITPIISSHPLVTAPGPLTTTGGSNIVTVEDISYHPYIGDYVIFTGMVAAQGITLNGMYQVQSLPTGTSYTVIANQTATSGTGVVTSGGGGTNAFAAYLVNVANTTTNTTTAWNSGSWGNGGWGGVNELALNNGTGLWTQYNFGEDLLFGAKQGAMYKWNATTAPTLAAPTQVTISNGSPTVVTLTTNTTVPIPSSTAIMFATTDTLPLGLAPYTVYYVTQLTSTTYNLSDTYAHYLAGVFLTTTSAGAGTHTISIRAIAVADLPAASDVPLTQNTLIVSDSSRFTIVFGSNEYLSTTYDPMLIRWSDQESVTNWTPSITNQAGSTRLSHGSEIKAVLQSRQELLVFTDSALYSLQYLGPPYVWGAQILADNISIISINAASYANGTAYWMGQDKFYKYDGRLQTLRCDLRQYIFDDINRDEFGQIFSGTNEGFNEVWWFYCGEGSTVPERYVIYNYAEDVWYYGFLTRTAWLDSSLRQYPLAATFTYSNLVYHENGVDNNQWVTPEAISSYIQTSQFDIDDGHNFAFVWRMLPDLTFRGSTDGTTPQLDLQIQPLQNSGSGITYPASVGGTDTPLGHVALATVSAVDVYPISADQFTGQVNIRVRGRQMSLAVFCDTLGTQWQLGAPRIDIRPDGRRGG